MAKFYLLKLRIYSTFILFHMPISNKLQNIGSDGHSHMSNITVNGNTVEQVDSLYTSAVPNHPPAAVKPI